MNCMKNGWNIKKGVANSPNTIKRHKQHYRKYFEPSLLDGKKICQVNELLLETECNRIVKDFNLPRKEWCNIKTILNACLNMPLEKNIWLKILWIR